MSIKEWPEGERPREKLLAHGAAALSDAELLAILLVRRNARYERGRFGPLFVERVWQFGEADEVDAKTLAAYKGMGLASYTQFAVVKEIGRRILGEDLQEQMVLSNPKSVADYLRPYLGHENRGQRCFASQPSKSIDCGTGIVAWYGGGKHGLYP